MIRLADVLDALQRWYPAETAESWDRVGLTCGDPAERIDRVLVALDCVPATVAEAVQLGAGLLLTHHPLLLQGVHGVPATTAKGAMVHRLIRHQVAHFAAHTNADIARYGVSEALADRLGLLDQVPLDPIDGPALDVLAVYVPIEAAARVADAVTAAGAGAIGHYDTCTWTVEGTGTFRPLAGSHPTVGEVGELTRLAEARLSVVLPRSGRSAVLAAMRAAHPYEEVAFELTEQPRQPAAIGTGRLGVLSQPIPLAAFVERVASRLPATPWGVRAAGDADQLVTTVAVCGGAGGGYAEQARRAGADVFVTADLRHHTTSEAVTEHLGRPMALVDAGHWASEQPWLEVVAGLLRHEFAGRLRVDVSQEVTDPFTLHVASGRTGSGPDRP